MALELDFMEGYSTDALAQAAYVTNATTYGPDILTGGTAYADLYTGVHTPDLACDNDTGTLWSTTGIGAFPHWWAYIGSVGKMIRQVRYYNYLDMGIKDYIIKGSNDSTNGADGTWTTITSGTFANTNPEGWQTITFANSVIYKSHMVYATKGYYALGQVVAYEFEMMELSLQSYSESTIKQQGSYSLKGIAAATDSLNKTLTRTIGSPIDLTGITQIRFAIRASRTGSNFKIGWRDSGLNVIEHTPNIIQSNTWEEQTVDISAVTNADKDAIDRIIFTVLNADAANIIYLDKMFSPQQFTKTFTETLTLSEVISKAPARTFLETITLSESSFIKGIGKTFTETITLSETFGRAISKLLKDTVTLTEVAARDIAIFFQETITLTDNIAKGITRTLSDSLSLTDVFTKVLKWLHISHIATTWNKVTKTLTNWTKTNRTNASWHKKYE